MITSQLRVRNERPRLIASWLCWLVVWLLLFTDEGGIHAFFLISLCSLLRPSDLNATTDRQRLGGAIALLLSLPLVAVLMGSSAANAFLRTPPGVIIIVAAWAISVLADLGFYRSLPPCRVSGHEPPTHVASSETD